MNFLYQHFEDFKALDFGSKICLVGSWITGAGIVVLLGASTITVANWLSQKELSPITKKALAVGIGATLGAGIFTCGAAMEDDRQDELNHQKALAFLAEKRKQRELSPCPNCKFFSNDCDLYCAVNPAVACTETAQTCKDFSPKE